MREADRGRMQLMATIAMAGVVVGTEASLETSPAGQGVWMGRVRTPPRRRSPSRRCSATRG
jgi:hypothetical protein